MPISFIIIDAKILNKIAQQIHIILKVITLMKLNLNQESTLSLNF